MTAQCLFFPRVHESIHELPWYLMDIYGERLYKPSFTRQKIFGTDGSGMRNIKNTTCSHKFLLTKDKKVHQRNVSPARLIVYTAHFIRAGLNFQDRVPVLSVLGLPLDLVQARLKFWSGTDRAISFTRLNLSVPKQFFSTRTFYIRTVSRIFCRVSGAFLVA